MAVQYVGGGGASKPSNTLTTNLRYGSKGDSVKALQRALGITADGSFGPATLRAVKSFQKANGLAVDGSVGPATRQVINTPKPASTPVAPAPKPTNWTGGLQDVGKQKAVPKAPTVAEQINAANPFSPSPAPKPTATPKTVPTPVLGGAQDVNTEKAVPKAPTYTPRPLPAPVRGGAQDVNTEKAVPKVVAPSPLPFNGAPKPTNWSGGLQDVGKEVSVPKAPAPVAQAPTPTPTPAPAKPVTNVAPVAKTPYTLPKVGGNVAKPVKPIGTPASYAAPTWSAPKASTPQPVYTQTPKPQEMVWKQPAQMEMPQAPQVDTSGYQNRMNQLNQQNQNLQNTYQTTQQQSQNQADQIRSRYDQSGAKADYEKMQKATIQDIASKYGFDFSRDYANRQSEAQAQEKRNAFNDSIRRNETQNKENLKGIDHNVREANTSLDHNYFQKMLAQQQNQANSGLNAGIAGDQNLRLAMGKQGQLANVYRDANLGRMQEANRFTNESSRLGESLALVEQQKEAQSERLFQELQMQGYDILGKDRDWARQLDRDMRSNMDMDLNRNERQQDRTRDQFESDRGFNYQQGRDARSEFESDRGFNRGTYEADRNFSQRQLEEARNQFEADRGYQRGTYESDRGFNRGTYESDRNHQYQQGRDARNEFESDRNFGRGSFESDRAFNWNQLLGEADLTGMYNGGKTWDRQLQEMRMKTQGQALSDFSTSAQGQNQTHASMLAKLTDDLLRDDLVAKQTKSGANLGAYWYDRGNPRNATPLKGTTSKSKPFGNNPIPAWY